MLDQPVLTICIPIYNRRMMFRYSLRAAAEAAGCCGELAQIVVSDDGSKEDIEGVVKEVQAAFPHVNIKYGRNGVNTGLAANFHKAVKLADGRFCWIVGGDDFICPDGVTNILRVIGENPDVDFISVRYSHMDFNRIADNTSEDPYHKIPEILKDPSQIRSHPAPDWCGRVSKWDELVDPCFDNVMLGAMMAGIFRKSLWDSVDTSGMKLLAFDRMENIYPHCAIYARSMPGRPAYYFGRPVIVVGDGAREWAGSNQEEFWTHFVPLIVFKMWDDILDAYEAGGMDRNQAEKYRRFNAKTVGELYIPYLIRRYILRKPVRMQEEIHAGAILRRMGRYGRFYSGMIKGMARGILRFIRRDKTHHW